MAAYPGRWAIAGGWALDLFLGQQTRPHGDVDIAVIRDEQRQLRRFLEGADARVAERGVLRPWAPDEQLDAPLHEIHATWPDGMKLEFLLNDVDSGANAWEFRRDARVRRPLERVIRSRDGVPYLSPEVVLLYKAKIRSAKDDADLLAVLPHLGSDDREWLASAIELAHGPHVWLDMLRDRGSR
jgi:hypothetical protein